jgi:hypothetical protein
MLTIPALTLLFICIVSGLATALVWMLWELEPKIAKLQRDHVHVFRDHLR